MNLGGLFTNKWFLLGAAGAAGLGLYTLIKRKKSGGASSGGAGAQETPAYAGGVGGFDSTGTDVAHWLGNQEQVLGNQFAEFQRSFFEQLGGVPTGATGTGALTDFAVHEGSTVQDVISAVSAYQPGFNAAQLAQLNPGLNFNQLAQSNANGYLSASNPGPATWTGFGGNATLKVPAKTS